jgi:hypothetical protein
VPFSTTVMVGACGALLLALTAAGGDGFERFLKRYPPKQVVEICDADAWKLPDGTVLTKEAIRDVCGRALKEMRR